MDVEKVADSIFKSVQDRIEKALSPLAERLTALEAKDIPSAASIVKDVLAADSLATLVDLQVAEAVAQIELPVPADGKDGDNGDPGKDGVGLAGAMIDRDGELVVTLTNGELKKLGKVVGNDGDPGRDGFGFDDMSAEYDGERTVTLKFKRGEHEKTFPFAIPMILHKGFWRDGMEAEEGDAYSHAGSLWIATKATKNRPSYEASEWILSVRKGRDGQDKTDAPPPEPVKLNGH